MEKCFIIGCGLPIGRYIIEQLVSTLEFGTSNFSIGT